MELQETLRRKHPLPTYTTVNCTKENKLFTNRRRACFVFMRRIEITTIDMQKSNLTLIDCERWGLVEYKEADQRQSEYVEEIKRGTRPSTLVFCQHPTVITVGRAAEEGHIVSEESELHRMGISVIANNRGGDVTLHNPGQLIGYPLFHLSHFKEDLHWFLRELEESIIQTLHVFGIESHRIDGLTGVWIEGTRKVCAIGVHCSRWVISHGFALNVANDTADFNHIIPCGIREKSVTSMSNELGYVVDIEKVADVCQEVIYNRFVELKKNLW